MSWLIAFNVINPYNQFVRSIWQGLNALTEPVLRPIRRWMPDLGGIDISPMVLIIISGSCRVCCCRCSPDHCDGDPIATLAVGEMRFTGVRARHA
jgi:hypothetical protein